MSKQLKLYHPIDPVFISQYFGLENTMPDMLEAYRKLKLLGHNGLDYHFFGESGRNVRSAHEGTVTYSGEDGAGGQTVVVRTNEKCEYNGDEVYFKTIYCHMIKGSLIKAGTVVKTGDIIGKMDSTGMSTGPHLHFGLKPVQQGEADWVWFNLEKDNGYNGAIDPMPYMQKETAYQVAGMYSKIQELKDKILNFNRNKTN